ncbi:MAG: hypothetical protein R2827_02700 [Bdellovibrionales bacterium]
MESWDLYRYPGIRSDSDMATMSYSFRPFQSTNITPQAKSQFDLRETAKGV